jgi:hypothetical protein
VNNIDLHDVPVVLQCFVETGVLCDDVVVLLIVVIGLPITEKVVVRFFGEAVDWQLAVDGGVLGKYVGHFIEKLLVFVRELGVGIRLPHV